MATDHRQASKFLSLLLRHEPEKIGIKLDEAGWVDVDVLLDALHAHGVEMTRATLDDIVATSDKQRFAFSEDKTKIRANQGHSVQVELDLPSEKPPAVLYHGTVDAVLPGIRAQGLVKGQRHHVHLSADIETAKKVGGRRGKPIVLAIKASEMIAAGHTFLRSANGVWLVDHVPPKFIELEDTVQHTDLVPRGGGTVSRAQKIEIAKQSLAACEAGFYTNGKGDKVEIAAALEDAKDGTGLYEMGIDRLDPPTKRAGTAPAAPPPTGATIGDRARYGGTAMSVTGETTIDAMVRLAKLDGHLGCLNFASAKRPGGGFLGGAQAQEESLARASGLYPCLQTQPEYYARNKAFGSALYQDTIVYSPNVPFFRDDNGGWFDAPVLASVITAAAPNVSALKENRKYDADDVALVLKNRSEFVLALAAHHKIDRLVLGAWGAGVFGNDPAQVALIFAKLLEAPFAGVFTEVVFAVLGTRETSANHRAFADVFRA
ncbi:MAG TPA: RNA 2'-phosphotransferase [Kofleriaceae bacterium]